MHIFIFMLVSPFNSCTLLPPNRSDTSHGTPTVQVSLEETDALEAHAMTQPRRQVRVPDVSLAVGVVTYLNPGLVFDYDWLVV